MSRSFDESFRLRVRDASRNDQVSRLDRSPALGSPSLLARTKSEGSYPTAASRFYACEPIGLLGQEVEGGTAVVSPLGGTLHALNLGTAVPPIGTQVLVTFVGNRWVFRHDG